MKLRQEYAIVLTLFFALASISHAKGQVKSMSGKDLSTHDLDKFLKAQMDSLQIPGLSIAIINKGKIVYQRAVGLGNIDTKSVVNEGSVFEAGSLSKTAFTYFVMKQVDKGLLELDTPLYKYMPYPDIKKDTRYKLITARMVLSHQTGFPNWRYFEMADSSLNVKYGDLYLKFTPGTQFAYSGEGYFYLSKVIAYLYNKNIQTLDLIFQSQVANPLKLMPFYFSGNDYVTSHMVSGHKKGKVFNKKWPTSFPTQDSSWFGAAGGLHTNSLAYARFLIALMDGMGISRKSMEEIFKPQVQLPKNNRSYKEGTYAWGLGIAPTKTPYGTMYEHGGNNGNFQSHYIICKEKRIGYVFFTNCDKGDDLNKKLKALLMQ